MNYIDLEDVELRRWDYDDFLRLIRAAAGVANAIHVGAGAMIKGTMMEEDFRAALRLKAGQLVNIPKASSDDQTELKHGD